MQAPEVLDCKLQTQTSKGRVLAHKARLTITPATIEFTKAPFALKDEIKAMAGSHWCGFDAKPKKVWTIDNCQRNWFQLKWLMGENPYEWFERPLVEHEYRSFPVMVKGNEEIWQMRDHQRLMSDTGLTYHYQLWGAEMGTGKTLAAQMVMEMSGVKDWFWLGPLKSMDNIEIEFEKFSFPLDDYNFKMTTYERLVRFMQQLKPGDPIPQGLIVDESSRTKSPTSQRSKAIQDLADMIRERYGMEGYVILMSGTPSPKSPLDWWKQCEIVWPGFLKEGSQKALERRLAFLVDGESQDGTQYKSRVGWKDDADKCLTCGEPKDSPNHFVDPEDEFPREIHKWEPSTNEVAFMYKRLNGLVTILHKHEVLDLPDKVYETDICEPSPSTLRAAQALMAAAPNVITGMTWLRELSDGFMYKDVEDGESKCSVCAASDAEHAGQVQEWFDPEDPEQGFEQIDFFDDDYIAKLEKRWVTCRRCYGKQTVTKYKRITREVPCPKEGKLISRLEECEEAGRVVIFAGFQGSVDRIQKICHKHHWSVVRCDGRGWHVTTSDGKLVKVDKALRYWMDLEANPRVAFVAHPQSGGLSLNLTEARMAIFYSNDFNPESRSQAEDRIHRMGMDENRGCKIVDIFHLPNDTHVRNVLLDNRRLELMTMGDFTRLQEQMVSAP
jgi:hypothetical protein